MLEIRNIQVGYGSSQVLQDVSLRVTLLEQVCVLGKNGVGKTTLLRAIMGLTPPKRGSITLYGKEISGLSPHEIARQGVAYVPQGNALFPEMTVEQNLLLATRDAKVLISRLDQVFNYFPDLKEKYKVKAGRLSGGQQKFVAIARGLITQPRLLLLDEPSEGIQPSIIQELGPIIKKIATNEKCLLLLVEQNRSLAFAVTDYAYILDRGRVAAEGKIGDLEKGGVVSKYMSF